MMTVRWVVDDRRESLRKPLSIAVFGARPARSSSRIRSKRARSSPPPCRS